jgi:hypothetical protein
VDVDRRQLVGRRLVNDYACPFPFPLFFLYCLLSWNPWQHVFFRLLDQLRTPLRC